jgi:hypothetical protein
VLALVAGLVGVVLALPINLVSSSFNAGITAPTLDFSFRVTITVVIQALLFAALIGIVGGWLPARRATKMLVGRKMVSGIEVKRGLKDGDLLIVAPPTNLSDGQKLRVLAASAVGGQRR